VRSLPKLCWHGFRSVLFVVTLHHNSEIFFRCQIGPTMKRKGVRKRQGLTAQTALRLPTDMLARLRETGPTRGLGEEIRRRLELSFAAEAGDAKTRQLRDALSAFASHPSIRALWHEDAYAFQMFKAGVNQLLQYFQPPGDPAGPSRVPFDVKDLPPDRIGAMLASQVFSGVWNPDAWPEVPKGVGPPLHSDEWLRSQPARDRRNVKSPPKR
jgi:hypothetical protein